MVETASKYMRLKHILTSQNVGQTMHVLPKFNYVKTSYNRELYQNFHITHMVQDLHAWCDVQQAGIQIGTT